MPKRKQEAIRQELQGYAGDMKCPYCQAYMRDLFGLALHLEDSHPDEYARAKVADAVALRVVEVDIDAIYRNRPDLVRSPLHKAP